MSTNTTTLDDDLATPERLELVRALSDLDDALERNRQAVDEGAMTPVGRGALIVLRQRVTNAEAKCA